MVRPRKCASQGKRQGSSRRRVHPGGEPSVPPAMAPEEPEKLFDEPAATAPEPAVPVEKPVTPPQRVKDPDACGPPDAARTLAEDLH
jgi:hypothetical protein